MLDVVGAGLVYEVQHVRRHLLAKGVGVFLSKRLSLWRAGVNFAISRTRVHVAACRRFAMLN